MKKLREKYQKAIKEKKRQTKPEKKLSISHKGLFSGEKNPMYGADRKGEKNPMYGRIGGGKP